MNLKMNLNAIAKMIQSQYESVSKGEFDKIR